MDDCKLNIFVGDLPLKWSIMLICNHWISWQSQRKMSM